MKICMIGKRNVMRSLSSTWNDEAIGRVFNGLELSEEVSHVGSEEYLDPTCAVKWELVEKKKMLLPADPVSVSRCM